MLGLLGIDIYSVSYTHLGTGDKEKALRDKVQKKALEEAVLFLGNREDVNELYQAMDIFVMPSRCV